MEIMLDNEKKVTQFLQKLGYKLKIINNEKRYLNVLFS